MSLSEKTRINRIAGTTCNIFKLSMLLMIVSCGGGGGGGGDAASSGPLRGSITTSTAVASNTTGANYQISVYRPADYETTTDDLPVIYAMDGGVDNGDRFEYHPERYA